ncbi:MAG: hypothetical protein FWC11_01800 [Firmicutes bacterium]|nr:hypothetical protein [Bacillota bacterium]
MEQKIILKKKGSLALFLYRRDWSGLVVETQFVVATLQNKDTYKHIGMTVDDWCWGKYFDHDLDQALDYFNMA